MSLDALQRLTTDLTTEQIAEKLSVVVDALTAARSRVQRMRDAEKPSDVIFGAERAIQFQERVLAILEAELVKRSGGGLS